MPDHRSRPAKRSAVCLAALFALQVNLSSFQQPQQKSFDSALSSVLAQAFWVLVGSGECVLLSRSYSRGPSAVLHPARERKPYSSPMRRRHTWLYVATLVKLWSKIPHKVADRYIFLHSASALFTAQPSLARSDRSPLSRLPTFSRRE